MENYVATKPINILDVGTFEKGTKWEGYKDSEVGWKLKLKGTDRYFYFPEKSIRKAFKIIEE